MGTAFSAAASKPDNEVPSSAVSPLQEKEEQKKEKIQDVLVPWVLAPKKGETSKKPKETKQPNPKQRKQSKERQQSPEESISGVENLHIDSSVLPSGSKPQSKTSLSEPMKSLEPEPIPKPESGPEPQVFHRYYHLFTAGELQSLVEAAGRAEGFCVIPSQSNGDDGNQTTKETDIEDGDDRDRIEGSDRDRIEGSVVEREEVVGRCEAGGEGKWLRVRAVGWEMDNWWLEGEVGK